jgi:GNAT superfamily N-acetyltransferase
MAFRVRSLQRGELDSFLTCFQAAFAVDTHAISIVRNSLMNDPYFHPDRIRVGLLDGLIVSIAVILNRAAYVGNHVVTVAGLTAVATDPDYQRRGFGTRVVQDAVRLIRQQGYDLSMLTTRLPGFFSRFGYREVPKVNGYECPASALSRLSVDPKFTIQKLDYHQQWPALAALYRNYSQGRTGMQVRDMRFWETWPRRGTFPHGFSSELDATGLVAVVAGQLVAYLAAHSPAEQPHLSVTELAHLRGHGAAALALVQTAAERYLRAGAGRAILHVGANAPILRLLEEQHVPLHIEVGPGLMVLIPKRSWVREAGFRNVGDAIENLFRSPSPAVWYRDGY